MGFYCGGYIHASMNYTTVSIVLIYAYTPYSDFYTTFYEANV